MSSNSTFIQKLYSMLEDPANQHRIAWNATLDGFKVFSPAEFSKEILPQCFKHSNFSSFVRQLNMYGFHKVNDQAFSIPPPMGADGQNSVPVEQAWEFRHPHFRRGEIELLQQIKRKTPAAKQQQTPPSQHRGSISEFKQEHLMLTEPVDMEMSSDSGRTISADEILQRLVSIEMRMASDAVPSMDGLRLSASPAVSGAHYCVASQRAYEDVSRLAHIVDRLGRLMCKTNDYLVRMAKEDDLANPFLRRRKEDAEILLEESQGVLRDAQQIINDAAQTAPYSPMPTLSACGSAGASPTLQHFSLNGSANTSMHGGDVAMKIDSEPSRQSPDSQSPFSSSAGGATPLPPPTLPAIGLRHCHTMPELSDHGVNIQVSDEHGNVHVNIGPATSLPAAAAIPALGTGPGGGSSSNDQSLAVGSMEQSGRLPPLSSSFGQQPKYDGSHAFFRTRHHSFSSSAAPSPTGSPLLDRQQNTTFLSPGDRPNPNLLSPPTGQSLPLSRTTSAPSRFLPSPRHMPYTLGPPTHSLPVSSSSSSSQNYFDSSQNRQTPWAKMASHMPRWLPIKRTSPPPQSAPRTSVISGPILGDANSRMPGTSPMPSQPFFPAAAAPPPSSSAMAGVSSTLSNIAEQPQHSGASASDNMSYAQDNGGGGGGGTTHGGHPQRFQGEVARS